MTNVPVQVPRKRSTDLIHPYVDFWLLGGASILLWALMWVGQYFRSGLPSAEARFMQIGYAFSMLTLICNHPHFLISYKIAYGRGLKFILKNWLPLIVAPLALGILFSLAYLCFDSDVGDNRFVGGMNSAIRDLGFGYQFGLQPALGADLLGVAVWLMYITVGWHYSKQVFGCMMVYSFYSKYEVTKWQRSIIKASLFGVAFLQFVSIYSRTDIPTVSFVSGRGITPLGLPQSFPIVATFLATLFFLVTIGAVFVRNYFRFKRLPPVNFVVAWVAFYVWWVPAISIPEFLFIVPFFHSLQYLPFAFRMEKDSFHKPQRYVGLTLKLLLLFAAGVVAFEVLPSVLDASLETSNQKGPYFFLEVIAVFINIHHFFIDSAIWKFSDPKVKNDLLYEVEALPLRQDGAALEQRPKVKREREFPRVI